MIWYSESRLYGLLIYLNVRVKAFNLSVDIEFRVSRERYLQIAV